MSTGNNIVDMVNYLTTRWAGFKDHQFLGFKPTYEGAVASLELDGMNYIACHVFFCDTEYLCKDEFFKEKPYILMFGGNDDLSYGKRYKTAREAKDFFGKNGKFTKHIQDQCLGYN